MGLYSTREKAEKEEASCLCEVTKFSGTDYESKITEVAVIGNGDDIIKQLQLQI